MPTCKSTKQTKTETFTEFSQQILTTLPKNSAVIVVKVTAF